MAQATAHNICGACGLEFELITDPARLSKIKERTPSPERSGAAAYWSAHQRPAVSSMRRPRTQRELGLKA